MSSMVIIFLIALLAAIMIDVVIIRWSVRKNRGRVASPQDVNIFGVYSPILTKVKPFFLHFQTYLKNQRDATTRRFTSIDWKRINLKMYLKNKWNAVNQRSYSIEWKKLRHRLIVQDMLWIGVELLIIFLWSISFTIPFFDMDPMVMPKGDEYPFTIQTHHLWTRWRQCGACAMWNGSTRGGDPAFVDPHGSMLHPLVIITTLLVGIQSGAKLALIGSFILAGMAQWWLAYVLGLGRIPRMWSGMIVVVSGHLASRMELGLFGVVLSTACVSLVLPAFIWLAKFGTRRAAVILGIMLAFSVLAGQGYMQVGLLFSLPAAIFLVPWDKVNLILLGKRFALSVLIAFLLAAPFMVPYLHFLPEFGKKTDLEFHIAEPFEYIPLNLVIGDHDFFRTEVLGKHPYPHIYENYVGWIAIVLAIYALFGSHSTQEKRAIRYLALVAFISLWIASAQPLKWLVDHLPSQKLIDMIAGIRHPSQISGLAAPAVLALAAIGLERLINLEWPSIPFRISSSRIWPKIDWIDLRWLMTIPLLYSLNDVRLVNQVWIQTIKQDPTVQKVNEVLLTPDLQWVNIPWGEHSYSEPAIGMGLKIANSIRTWYWINHELPQPVLEVNFVDPPPGMTHIASIEDIPLYKAPPGREYARVLYSDRTETKVCQAHGTGGNIDVTCQTQADGTLVVLENSWTGWYAELDGNPVPLQLNQWLSITLPAGEHRISFRYRPWDVPLGIVLSLFGLFISIVFWVKKEPPSISKETSDTEPQSQESNQEQTEVE